MNQPGTKNYLWQLVACFFAIFMFTQPFVNYPMLLGVSPSWYSLDDSGRMALNYALMHKLTWGKEVVFVYGPLGFLATRVGWGLSRWSFLLFDLFIAINFFFVFKELLIKATDKFLAIAIIFCLVLLIPAYLGSGTSFIVSFFICFWIYKSFEEPRILYFILLSVLIGLSLFIKLNTGLMGMLFLVLHLCNLIACKKIQPGKAVVALLMPFIVILISAALLHVSLIAYIKTAVELIKGANDIQYLNEDQGRIEHNLAILCLGITGIYIWYAVLLIKRKTYAGLLYVLIPILYIFLLRKQSISRNDIQHLTEFFAFGPIILLQGNVFNSDERTQRNFLRGILALSLFSLFFTSERTHIDNAFDQRFTSTFNTIKAFRTFNSDGYLGQENKRYIPKEILSKINKATVDVFPWDCNLLFQNKLNFKPRPVYQSYNAFTPYLQTLNYTAFVQSPPSYILYDYDAIDGRCAFDDECMLNLFITRNYSIVDTFRSNERLEIVLQKKAFTSPVIFEKIKEVIVPSQQEILVENASLFKVHIDYNLKGRLMAFWSKPSPVYLLLTKQNGETISYKTSPQLLQAGIMVDRAVIDTHDYHNYIANRNILPRVAKVKLLLDGNYYSDNATVAYYTIK